MAYKIIFSDIDGTLLNSERELSPKTIQTINQLKDKLPVVLISARMPKAMRHLQTDLQIDNHPIISYNGGLILIDGQTVSSTEIPLQTLSALQNFNTSIDCHLSLYHKNEWYVPRYDRWAKREENNTRVKPEIKPNMEVIKKWKSENKGAHKVMAMGPEDHIDQISDFLKKKFEGQLHLYRSKSTYLEIANSDISKFSAIEYLLENHYNIDVKDCVAFGDNYNDVEMIKGVGLGIAVGNARREVLDVAKKVTGHGKEDGVAISLCEIFKL